MDDQAITLRLVAYDRAKANNSRCRAGLRRAERLYIASRVVSSSSRLLFPPAECGPAETARQAIAHHARPSTVAVRERMDRNQPMVEADSNLVFRV